MLPSLAFVPKNEVIDCFNLLMQNFPESAICVPTYLEHNYIRKKICRSNSQNTYLSHTHLEHVWMDEPQTFKNKQLS